MNEETIFAVAREKKTLAERQAYLDQACAKNTGVRAAVEELLRADDDAGSFLEHAPAGMEATVASEASSRDTVDDGLWATALPFLKAYQHLGHVPRDFPVAFANQSRILSLPIYAEMSDEQIDHVIGALKAYYQTASRATIAAV